MPGCVQSICAVKYTQVIGLAPHDHLAPQPQGERNIRQLDVAIDLAKRALKAQCTSGAKAQVRQFAIPTSPPLIRKHLLAWARLEVIHTVIRPPVQADEVGGLNPRNGQTAKCLPVSNPVVLKPQTSGVALLDNRPFINLWVTKDLLRLQIARERQRIRGELGFSRGKQHE